MWRDGEKEGEEKEWRDEGPKKERKRRSVSIYPGRKDEKKMERDGRISTIRTNQQKMQK